MDLFDTLRSNLDELVKKWREVNADGKLEAKEVGALVILAGQSVAWTIGVGRADGLAIQTAAERLFDEILAPFVVDGVDKVRPKSPWWKNLLGIFAVRAVRQNIPEGREYYVKFISGALQAMGLVIVTERLNAQADVEHRVGAIPFGGSGPLLGAGGQVVGGLEHRPHGLCLTSVHDVVAALGT